MHSYIFLTICLGTTLGAMVPQDLVLQPKFTVPFLPGMNIDLSGLTLETFFKTMDGWGLFNLGTDVSNMIFTLQNAGNNYKDYVLKPEDPRSFLDSSWDKTQKTKIVIHGYAEDGSGGPLANTKKIITAYANAKRPENLVFVDWHKLGRQLNYFDSARNTEKAGLRVAELLVYLKGAGLIQSLDDVHLIGFSLGAHVSAIAAHFARQVLGETIARISGLDPAGPGFAKIPDEYRLVKEDAKFVDVIHTNMGTLITTFGTTKISGQVDFYPNGGEHQPGCFLPIVGEVVGVCSHLMAIDYFANSITGKLYPSCPCQDYKTYKTGSCACTNPILMGEFVDQTATGQYYATIPLNQI